MTGRNPAAEVCTRRYRTFEEGLQLLHAAGYIDHVDLVAALFEELANPALARFGDIVAVKSDVGPYRPAAPLALGVVSGPVIFVTRLRGLGTKPLTDALRAFRIEGPA